MLIAAPTRGAIHRGPNWVARTRLRAERRREGEENRGGDGCSPARALDQRSKIGGPPLPDNSEVANP